MEGGADKGMASTSRAKGRGEKRRRDAGALLAAYRRRSSVNFKWQSLQASACSSSTQTTVLPCSSYSRCSGHGQRGMGRAPSCRKTGLHSTPH